MRTAPFGSNRAYTSTGHDAALQYFFPLLAPDFVSLVSRAEMRMLAHSFEGLIPDFPTVAVKSGKSIDFNGNILKKQ